MIQMTRGGREVVKESQKAFSRKKNHVTLGQRMHKELRTGEKVLGKTLHSDN